jgi:hypothetical protein
VDFAQVREDEVREPRAGQPDFTAGPG